MERCEVERIFGKVKSSLLDFSPACDTPLACVLGGQPSSGKSYMTKVIENQCNNVDFLTINGDLYRVFHPDYEILAHNVLAFSHETQIFSNVFTEKLIEESVKNRLNVVVEGTMRNPKVPLQTVNRYKQANFRVEAYIVAAPAEFTEIGIFHRFQKEMEVNGIGRLAEIASHNEAISSLLTSADELYKQKAVDKIAIYSYLAEEKVAEYEFDGKCWNSDILPSAVIEKSRKNQLANKESVLQMLQLGEETLLNLSSEFQPYLRESLRKMKLSQKPGFVIASRKRSNPEHGL